MTTSHEFFRQQPVVEWYEPHPANSGIIAPGMWYQARTIRQWRSWHPWDKSWGPWFTEKFAIPDVPVRVIPASLADEDPDTR